MKTIRITLTLTAISLLLTACATSTTPGGIAPSGGTPRTEAAMGAAPDQPITGPTTLPPAPATAASDAGARPPVVPVASTPDHESPPTENSTSRHALAAEWVRQQVATVISKLPDLPVATSRASRPAGPSIALAAHIKADALKMGDSVALRYRLQDQQAIQANTLQFIVNGQDRSEDLRFVGDPVAAGYAGIPLKQKYGFKTGKNVLEVRAKDNDGASVTARFELTIKV